MFKILTTNHDARLGEFHTHHGTIKTPVFMNVGTAAAIKGALSTQDLYTIGCQVQLSNTYHLHLRPGDQVIAQLGGLHKFMNWTRPILTDSGGFQIFSLAKLRKIEEDGVKFASHIDGRRIFMTPESCMQIQSNLGSTIAMALDECVANPSPRDYVEQSANLTYRWLTRCKAENARLNDEKRTRQLLFGINQGGVYGDIRVENMRQIADLDLPGYAIGGLAVGETAAQMYHIIDNVAPHMPQNKPRYLMGVGTPTNIVEAVSRGIDFFDCVMPTRNARHAHLFTNEGPINLLNAKYELDDSPISKSCDCPTCQNHSRAYLRHLFKAKETLAHRLATLHNLYYYNTLMEKIRDSISKNRFNQLKNEVLERYPE